jgi:hypothetical protein
MLYAHGPQTWWEGHREGAEGPGGEDGEYREQSEVMAHGYKLQKVNEVVSTIQ